MRIQLLYSLALSFRDAETYYNNTRDNKWKTNMEEIIKACELTEKEENKFNRICEELGC